ncbi:MAG TPA: thioredoxin-disulfide reductase [Armatimonadota bacterium]|nr:thioredoxin-disulfide reductase [Armatimonadota bacterium]
MSVKNVMIIGSGPAALTAAIYTARANLEPLLLEGREPGGQLMITSDVENYPGFRDPITGPELMEQMTEQARRVGTEILPLHCDEVELGRRPFIVRAADEEFETRTLIIATGASARWLGIPSERILQGHGLSACATCDGFFFRNRDVAVIGGGDTAMEEALFLSRLAKSVTVIHRRDTFRASKIMQDRARSHEKIRFVLDTVIEEILDPAQGTVTGLKLLNVKTRERTEMPIEGIFIAIGHEPNTKFIHGQLETDELGYLILKKGQQTSIPGCFAAGDVHDRTYRQAVTAAGAGCAAAIEAERYLESEHV